MGRLLGNEGATVMSGSILGKSGNSAQPQPKGPVPEPEVMNQSPKKRSLLPLFFAAAVITTGAAYWYLSRASQPEVIRLSGRIEAYSTDIGTKVPGRVESVSVREGDTVSPGQLLVKLDDAEVNAQLQGATARLNASQQQELQALLQIEILENQIREAELIQQQSLGDASGRIFQAESNLASTIAQLSQSEAQVAQAQAELELAEKNRDRLGQLLAQGAISQQQFDQAATAVATARASLISRQAAVESFRRLGNAAEGQLQQAQATSLNPNIRSVQLQSLRTQLEQTRLKLAAARADVASARAAQQEIQARIGNQNITSPTSGVVTARSIEPGAVVTTGRTLLTIIDPQQVYLRGFIPEGSISRVKVGQDVRVFLSSAPSRPIYGRVTAIDPQASFTPENIYFREDRVRQVFGIKISLDNTDGLAKPGMSADAELVE